MAQKKTSDKNENTKVNEKAVETEQVNAAESDSKTKTPSAEEPEAKEPKDAEKKSAKAAKTTPAAKILNPCHEEFDRPVQVFRKPNGLGAPEYFTGHLTHYDNPVDGWLEVHGRFRTLGTDVGYIRVR